MEEPTRVCVAIYHMLLSCSDLSPASLLNYITATHAVSLFPRTTFIRRTTVTCNDMTNSSPREYADLLSLYRSRGYSIIDHDSFLPRIREVDTWERSVGDRLTWVLPFSRSVRKYHPVTTYFLADVLDGDRCGT